MNNNIENEDKEIVGGRAPLESRRPSWERMPHESVLAYEAAWLYFKMGRSRSHEAVAETLGKLRCQMQRWSKPWTWVARARDYDDHLTRIEQNAIEIKARESATMWRRRVEEHLEKKFLRGERLENKADQMLAFPLAKVTKDDGKTTVIPVGWNVRDAATIGAMGTKMKEEAMDAALKETVATGSEEEWDVTWNVEPYTPK